MVLDTTYKSKENKLLITDLVGKSFSFFESLKMNGIGCKRMVIVNVSTNLKSCLNTVSDINYANIELRPGGILIHINKGLKNFTWAIPYYHLVIYKTNGTSIHAQGHFIHFKNNKNLKENKKFFNEMLNEKTKYDNQYNFHHI